MLRWLLVLACSSPPSPPVEASPPSPPSAPQAPASLTVVSTIGRAPFYAPGVPFALGVAPDLVAVGRGTNVDLYDPEGAWLRTLSPTVAPVTASGLGGVGTGALGGFPQSVRVASDRVGVALGSGGFRVHARADGAVLAEGSALDVVHDLALLPEGFVTAHGGEAYANGHHIVEPTGPCGLCLWSPAGERLATVSPAEVGAWATAVGASPDGAWIAVGTADGRVILLDGKLAQRSVVRAANARIEQVEVDDHGDVVALSEISDVVVVKDGKRSRLAQGDDVAYSSALGAGLAAFAYSLGAVALVDATTGTRAATVQLPEQAYGLALATDGTLFVSSSDGHVRRWRSGAFLDPTEGGGAVADLAFVDDGARVVARTGQELRVFDAASGALEGAPRALQALLWSSSVGSDGRVALAWAMTESGVEDLAGGGRRALAFDTDGSAVTSVELGPNGLVAAVSYERLWIGVPGGRHVEWKATAAVSDVAFAADGRRLAAVTQDGKLVVLDAEAGAVAFEVALAGPSAGVAWGGDVLAVANGLDRVELRAAADGAALATVDLGSDLASFAVAPSGRRVAIGLANGELVGADAATGAVLGRSALHVGYVKTVATGPERDGVWTVASGGQDGRVVVTAIR